MGAEGLVGGGDVLLVAVAAAESVGAVGGRRGCPPPWVFPREVSRGPPCLHEDARPTLNVLFLIISKMDAVQTFGRKKTAVAGT